MKRRIVAAGGLALTLLAAACGGNDAPALSPAPIPSLLPATPTASVSIYPPPGQSPSGDGQASPAPDGSSPGAVGGDFPNSAVKQTDVKATGKVDGQTIELAFDHVVEYPMYDPKGTVNLTWADEAGNAMTIGGKVYQGTQKTSGTMALSLVVGSPKFDTYGSGDGTCQVTFDKVAKNYLAGSFTCRKLTGANGTTLAGATGTFTARF